MVIVSIANRAHATQIFIHCWIFAATEGDEHHCPNQYSVKT